MSEDDRAGEFGPIYLPALQRIRDLWLELEPLVDTTSYDDVVAPTELQISLSDGRGDAESGANWGCTRSITSIAKTSTGDLIGTRIHIPPKPISTHRPTPARRPPNRPVSTYSRCHS
jgi:hypothetical protein